MSEHMKMHHTSAKSHSSTFLMSGDGHVFKVPKKIFENYIDKYEVTRKDQIEKAKKNIRWEDGVTPGEAFADLNAKYSKRGVLVRGIRHRENLNQADFAKKIGISQSDLSKIENGKRPIGTEIGNRIIKKFKLNNRIFN